MQLTDFLDRVERGDVAAVAATLDAHPEWLAAQGKNERLWTGGYNALAVAALSGQTAVVQLLLARGAHLATPVAAGVSPIALAAIEGRTDVVTVLLSGGVTVDLFAAAAIGDAQRVTTFVRSHPALVRERTFDGKTPLHFCRGVEVAQVLLTAGADIDAVDDSGHTPLQWISATGKYKPVCRYLIAQGAKAEASDIFWACSYGDVPAVLRFLEADPLSSTPAARLNPASMRPGLAGRRCTRRPCAARRRSGDCSSSAAPMSTRAVEATTPPRCMSRPSVDIGSWSISCSRPTPIAKPWTVASARLRKSGRSSLAIRSLPRI